jgi:GNAT superfamily N-acetyltransferase
MPDQILFEVSPPLENAPLNALFSAGSAGNGWPAWQDAPDTSDWQPVLRHGLVYVCAFHDEQLVGFVNIAWDGRDHAFLLDPRVHPAYRRRGIGRELVSRAAEAARERGCEWLHVDYEPDLALFYERCGFVPTAAGLLSLPSNRDGRGTA